MWPIIALAAGLLAAPTWPSLAEEAGDLRKCAAETNSVLRLECYDAAAKRRGLLGTQRDLTIDSGKWQARSYTSKLDDSSNVTLWLDSNEVVSARLAENERARLVVTCRESNTDFYINFNTFISTSSVELTYRIGRQKAVTEKWSISTDHQALGLWNAQGAIPFIRKLFGHEQLLVRVTPYGESALLLTFDIAGLQQAIKPLQQACKWDDESIAAAKAAKQRAAQIALAAAKREAIKHLNDMGFEPNSGKDLAAAIKRFQRYAGIDQNGVFTMELAHRIRIAWEYTGEGVELRRR